MVVCPIESVAEAAAVEPRKKCETTIRAGQLMSLGKRHYICGEVQDAIDSFSQACELLAGKYGQTADQLATPYLYYGKSLLEMARIENGVLGHAVQEGSALAAEEDVAYESDNESKTSSIEIEDEELPEEKRVEIRKDVEHAMREGNLYNDQMTEDEGTEDEGEEIQDEEGEEKETTKPSATENGKSTTEEAPKKSATEEEIVEEDETMEQDPPLQKIHEGKEVHKFKPKTDDKTEEGEDEEVTTMQLSWEMLELSYTIFKRIGTEACMKQAECKHLLGQVSMEKEHYSQAVEDFIEAYELQRKVLDDGDRRIAESCYSVGLAYSFDKKFPESLTWYRQAVGALESRITHLEQKLRMRAAEEFGEEMKSAGYTIIQKEVEELKDLVVLEMNTKIKDVEQSQIHYTSSINAMKTMGKDVFPTGGAGHFDGGFDSTDKPVDNTKASDISHKIVRKRKSEVESDGSSEIKKVKNATEGAIVRAEQQA